MLLGYLQDKTQVELSAQSWSKYLQQKLHKIESNKNGNENDFNNYLDFGDFVRYMD